MNFMIKLFIAESARVCRAWPKQFFYATPLDSSIAVPSACEKLPMTYSGRSVTMASYALL